MSNTNSLKSLIKNIADAIRNRTSKTATMSIEEMPNEIASIQGPYPTQSKTVNVKDNGEVVVTPDSGYVLDKVTANVNVVAVSDNNAKIVVDNTMTNSQHKGVIEGLRSIDVGEWDTSSLEDIDNFFKDCSKLEEIKNIDTLDVSSCNSLNSTFSGCKMLKDIDVSGWNTTKVIDIAAIFQNCETLHKADLSSWSTAQLKYAHGAFAGCRALEEVNVTGLITSKCTYIANQYASSLGFFYDCRKLKTIIGLETWDVSKCEAFTTLFWQCSSLTDLDLSNWDTSSVVHMGNVEGYSIFSYCSSLTTVTFGNNWGSNEGLSKIMLGSSNGLNKASILDLFNKLATRTNSPTLSLNNDTVKAELTEEELAIATNKGWVVS